MKCKVKGNRRPALDRREHPRGHIRSLPRARSEPPEEGSRHGRRRIVGIINRSDITQYSMRAYLDKREEDAA